MLRRSMIGLMSAFVLALSCVMGQAIAAEPSMQEVYQAAQSGNFKAAQSMMDQVLKDHPNSGKAHFVQAEIFAKEGKLDRAKAELATAEQLSPGLPGEKPEAVQALRKYLASGGVVASANQVKQVVVQQVKPSFPWGWVIGGLALMGVLLYVAFGRKQAPTYAPMPTNGAGPTPTFGRGFGNPVPPAGPAGGMPGQPMGYPPAAPPAPAAPAAGGLGSGLMGSLATGAALGAGVVAGEALMHRVMGDGHHDRGSNDFMSPAYAAQPDPSWDNPAPQPFDMGGQNFGVNDASSWDDGGGNDGGGDGSNDWD